MMSDNDENEKTVLKEHRDTSDSGAPDKTEESWLHKTLESFSSSFEEQQRVHADIE